MPPSRHVVAIDAKRYLTYVAKRIQLPERDSHGTAAGRRCFRKHAVSPRSCALLLSLFWYLHVKHHQPFSGRQQDLLLDELSARFVGLFFALPVTDRDYFLEVRPPPSAVIAHMLRVRGLMSGEG